MSSINNYLKNLKNPYVWKTYVFLRYLQLLPKRARIASGYLLPTFRQAVTWLSKSRETANFSYNLSNLNKNYLAHTISIVTGQSVAKIKGYINEIETNDQLKRHVAMGIKLSPDSYRLGPLVAYARRVGWYAIARAIKPEVVVETGVEQGLGSCILAEALRRNSKEGKSGRYFGTDILPSAGSLFTGEYKKYGEILYGDSIKSLKKFKHKIDLFINDSDHHSNYEKKEYDTIRKLLRRKSVVLGDNSHGSDTLCEFAQKTGRNFLFFKEEPTNHWYAGAGIGIAYRKK